MDARTEARRETLNLAERFAAAGRSWVEGGPDGTSVRHPAAGERPPQRCRRTTVGTGRSVAANLKFTVVAVAEGVAVDRVDNESRTATTQSGRTRFEAVRRRVQRGALLVPDLLVAAAAEASGLAVLHSDADFDRTAAVTGQRVEWVVPNGSVD